MTYRDDRTALQNRVEELQQELEVARRQGEAHGREEAMLRTRVLERQVETLQRDLERIGTDLRALRGEAPPRRPRGMLVAGVVVLGAIGGYLVTRRSAPPPLPLAPPATAANAMPTPTPPPTPEPPLPPRPEPAKAELETRTAKPRWKATVRHADGLALPPGTPCFLDATLQTKKTNAGVRDFVVTCGAHKLYDKSDALEGMATMDDDARERLGAGDDQSTFTIHYTDIGARTGARAQVDLDSTKHEGVVFRETLPRYRVDLILPAESLPTTPLSGPEQRVHRGGHVTELSGASPVKSGAACVLRAMPTGQEEACVAEVTCGKVVLFPVSASVRCTYAGARPSGLTSTDDARTLEVNDSSLVVKTEGASGFRALIAFDPG